jgi:hypothetical protein
MDIVLADVYAILINVARNHDQLTYGDLSRKYYERTGDWHEPHGSWDLPLGELNRLLHTVSWPPLSAVVVLNDDNREPGGQFWESSPNIPRRPTDEIARISIYGQILGQVHNVPWSANIPIAPPESGKNA